MIGRGGEREREREDSRETVGRRSGGVKEGWGVMGRGVIGKG